MGDETVPSSRESGMTGFLPGAPARALFVCESPPPTVMIVSSRVCVWMSIDNRMEVRRTLPPPRGDVEPWLWDFFSNPPWGDI